MKYIWNYLLFFLFKQSQKIIFREIIYFSTYRVYFGTEFFFTSWSRHTAFALKSIETNFLSLKNNKSFYKTENFKNFSFTEVRTPICEITSTLNKFWDFKLFFFNFILLSGFSKVVGHAHVIASFWRMFCCRHFYIS